MLKSSLCDYSDAYILGEWTISTTTQAGNNRNNEEKEVKIKKNCCIYRSKISNTKIGNA